MKETASEKLVREHGAKVVCKVCEVRDECLKWGIATKGRGIFGGTTDRERRGLVWIRDRRTR